MPTNDQICGSTSSIQKRFHMLSRNVAATGMMQGLGLLLVLPLAITFAQPVHAGTGLGDRMMMTDGGMTMGGNKDQLPSDCERISKDVEITVHVGRKYAKPGFVYGYDQYQWQVPPCSRVKVTLINDDQVRHMWMLHGLPTYLYSRGMFNVEANGGKQVTGTLIVPSDDATLLAHCGVAQHTEKGLKAELKIGKGNKDLPSIPGISPPNYTGTLGD